MYLLERLNKLRISNSVPPVHYARSGFSQFRVNYILKENFFSHYDKQGIVNSYYFTALGNLYYVEEALGMSQSSMPYFNSENVEIEAGGLLDEMVYNDAEANWSHRDTLLDPCFNYADISIGWTSTKLVLVVGMIGAWVKWRIKPNYSHGIFTMSGETIKMLPQYVIVFYYHPSEVNPNSIHYNFGRPLFGVVPYPYYLEGIETVRPVRWVLKENYFDISFPINVTRGVYTVVIHAKDPRGIVWKPYTNKKVGECNILSYTFVA